MRRSVKVAALTSAAALLAIGASMTSFAAARGWTQEDGEWVWLDSYGERATATFKMSGNNYYYLNDDGYLASDELVEYEDHWYYVDENGAMLRNAWKEVENTDDDEDFEDTIWYYFQSSGKAYENTKKTINGKTYIFNNDGKMLYGWINDKNGSSGEYEMIDHDDEDTLEWQGADYYAGAADDGAVVTNAWRQIRVHDESPYLKDNDLNDNNDDYDYWFYFGSNGKKYKLSETDALTKDYTEKTIKGVKYAFALDGHMASEWVHEEASASSGVRYFSDPESGARVTKGWFKVVPSYAIDDEDYEGGNDEAHWFYADNKGALPYNEVKSINGKKYLFDDNGELLAGLRYITYAIETDEDDKEQTVISNISSDLTGSSKTEDDLDVYTTVENAEGLSSSIAKTGMYYFAKPIDTDATMKTGSCTLTIDGDSYSFKFESSGAQKGKGINGPDGNSYYVNGRKLKADSDQKFEIYECTLTESGKKVDKLYGEALNATDLASLGNHSSYEGSDGFAVISSSGSIIKSGTKKDGDDYKITVKDYRVRSIKDSDDTEYTFDETTVTKITTK